MKDVAFEVNEGEVFALLGPNGAGKTTIIEILEGFRKRDRVALRCSVSTRRIRRPAASCENAWGSCSKSSPSSHSCRSAKR